jgi:hypothetical protein
MTEPYKNEAGQIAVCKYQASPKLVSVADAEYMFMVQHYISLAWVEPKHVGYVLNIKKNCSCSGKGAPLFRLATEHDVLMWEGKISR